MENRAVLNAISARSRTVRFDRTHDESVHEPGRSVTEPSTTAGLKSDSVTADREAKSDWSATCHGTTLTRPRFSKTSAGRTERGATGRCVRSRTHNPGTQ